MSLYYTDDLVTLHHGDALTVARELETGSVQTIVTSPPYFGLRDYGVDGQTGAESTVAEYIDGMVALFHELRRVLADDGTLWLNLGDSYSSPPRGSDKGWDKSRLSNPGRVQKIQFASQRVGREVEFDRPRKNLLMIPARVALALQDDGWILRSDIIWAKRNHMPESVTDRPTRSHEHIFFFSKSARYFYDAEAIREPDAGADNDHREVLAGQPALEPSGGLRSPHRGLRTPNGRNGLGRNKRDVWFVATVPFPEAHFAAYPPELIRPCILAGSRPGDTVLDPFSGSGTTGMVATQEGRKYVGIDLNADYLRLSLETRFAQPVLNMEALA